MVTVNKNSDELRNGRRSRGASPNGYSDDSSASEPEAEGQMRVGSDYQAVIPPFNSKPDVRADAMLVWAPSRTLPESRVDQYLKHAKEKHNYNIEQSLGMLFWHRHDVEKALADLSNFTPFPDEWTVEDKVLFEQAFSFHGKSFHRIRQMLPDKSIAALVKYYYSWKKTRSRTSLMDRQARRFNSQEAADSDDSDGSGANDSDFDNSKENGKTEKKECCSNCGIASSQQHSTPKGNLCSTCYQYWRRTGLMRPNVGPRKESHHASHGRHNPIKNRRKPPRGMYMNAEDLHVIASGPQGQGEHILKSLDAELVQLKRQVQNNKQMLSVLKHKTQDGIDSFKVAEGNQKVNARWTNEELLLAVQGVRKYGKNFRAIAETIGNKTEGHIRSFYVSYRLRYNLEECLKEYEAENGKQEDIDEVEEKMETDEKTSVATTTTAEGSAVPSPMAVVSETKPAVESKAGPPPLLKQPPGSPQKTSITPRITAPGRPTLLQPPPLIKPTAPSPSTTA